MVSIVLIVVSNLL